MKRIYALDGLRGIAAIAVMLFHIGQSYQTSLMPSGYLAVDLFFILSGFMTQPLKLIGEKLHVSPALSMAAVAMTACVAAHALDKVDESMRSMIKRRSRILPQAG